MRKTILILLALLLFSFLNVLFSQSKEKIHDAHHEITIYAIPTLYPLNWESPTELYNSMLNNYIKTAFIRKKYLIGHLAVQINSPVLKDTILTGMASFDSKEKTRLFLKDKIGFGVLGVAMKGKLESKEDLKRNLEIYKKRQKLAYITFRVNENALKRMLKFIDVFKTENNQQPAACNYYGGTFWPLYKNEGAGCSAFGLALLATAGILPEEAKDWQINIRIPMDLVGGEFNQMKKVKFSEIRNTDSWADKDLLKNVEYVPFQIYDPSYIYDWIICERLCNNSKYLKVEKDNIPGLYTDCSMVQIDTTQPIFTTRPERNLFMEFYKPE